METVPPYLLSPYGNREHALDLTRTTTGLPLPAAHALVLTLDAVSAAVLRTATIPDTEAIPILAALWQQPERMADSPAPVRREAATSPRGAYLPGLGQRIHVVRRARRLTAAGVSRRAGIHVSVLRDLEAGVSWPTLPLLLRLAAVFQVPVAMLVDDAATPLRILRLLATTRAA